MFKAEERLAPAQGVSIFHAGLGRKKCSRREDKQDDVTLIVTRVR